MAAHNFVIAGAEWSGVAHPQSHKHAANVQLLQRAAAPQLVRDAWDRLEKLRAGNVYGGSKDTAAGNEARDHLRTITDWAAALHP